MMHLVLSLVTVMTTVTVVVQSAELVSQLNSPDEIARRQAVAELDRKIAADVLGLADESIQEALVSVLELENARILENVAAFRQTGRSTLGEAYGEYYAQLLGLADKVRAGGLATANTERATRLRRALVLGAYNPESDFAKEIAREGESIVPWVVELTKRSDAPSRWNGYALIGEIFAAQEKGLVRAPLSPSSASSLRVTARAGLLDPASDVRIWAIFAVASARDRDAIPLLSRLAESDPDTDTGPAKYSVRSRAADALRRIR
jgi:hypothetical protein